MEKFITFNMIVNFLTYFSVGMILLGAFTWLYVKVTPYDEFAMIKSGNVNSAISLVGAMIGFTLPVLSVSYHGINLLDFIFWSALAMSIQLAVFWPVYKWLDGSLHENKAAATLYAGLCVVVGLFNAFSLIP